MNSELLTKIKEEYIKVQTTRKQRVNYSFKRAEARYLRLKNQLAHKYYTSPPEEVVKKIEQVLNAAQENGLQLKVDIDTKYYNAYFCVHLNGNYIKDKVNIPVNGEITARTDGSIQLEVHSETKDTVLYYRRNRVFRISMGKRLTIKNEVLKVLLDK